MLALCFYGCSSESHRLLVLNSEMWIERHQPRLFINCFYPLLNIKLLVTYRLITRARVVLFPGASPDDQNKKKTLSDAWQNIA